MKDNVNKQLSTSYRLSLERDIKEMLMEIESMEPVTKKQKLDTDMDLNTIYWRICVCNALLVAAGGQMITHHHLNLLKNGSDSNYQFMCEVCKKCCK